MAGAKRNILVLDDDPDIGAMLTLVLQSNGYRVVAVQSGKEAQQVMVNENISLLITDLLLSGDDGRDICRSLKENEKTASIPVLMFSAHPDAEKASLAAGASAFLPKPFDVAQLLEKVDLLVGNQ
jgi:DNA-binding response OmpR family regulator